MTSLFQKLLNATVTVVPTANWPTLTAQIKGRGDKTVLFYGHYDTQPAGDTALWQSEPFKLTQRRGRLYGRGVGDNKGQLIAQIMGLYSYLQTHASLPFNVIFLVEGEEEMSSLNLATTVKKLKPTLLKRVDLAVVVDGAMSASGQHVLRLGNRGILGFELTATTASMDHHSGNTGNVAINAIQVVNTAVAKLYDADTHHVKIPNFYDGVPSEDQIRTDLIDQLPYDAAAIQRQLSLLAPLTKLAYYRRLMYEPTFNLAGITGGYTGSGLKTIVPHAATVKIDCRLVGRQNIDKIKVGIEQRLAPELASGYLKLTYLGAVPASSSVFSQTTLTGLLKIVRSATGGGLIEPVMPGSVPNYVWTDILNVPTITIPYANADEQNHAPNENLTLKAFFDGIRLSYELAAQLASLL